MGKTIRGKGKAPSTRHDPLAQQLASDQAIIKRARRAKSDAGGSSSAHARPSDDTRMLDLARSQLDEIAAEEMEDRGEGTSKSVPADQEGDEGEPDEELEEGEDVEYYEELEIDEDDQAALDAFMPSFDRPRNLADLVMEKLDEREERGRSGRRPLIDDGPAESSEPALSNPKVIEVYSKVGQLLSRYKSGPLPKAFKILPTLPYWPALVDISQPDTWTPHAVYAATRIFAAQLDAKGCQRFYRAVLLERVRDEIAEDRKLSVHTYGALKVALRKPAAFFKGILFPLCASGSCTLREAAIVSSVLVKVSVPVLHSAAAIAKLADMDYSGPNSLFLRVLLDKKYAMPYKVIDTVVDHFCRFRRDPQPLPVLWHQALLVFVQRYKADCTPEQKEAILELLRFKSHPQISPEIRRELASAVCRGEIDPDAMQVESVWA